MPRGKNGEEPARRGAPRFFGEAGGIVRDRLAFFLAVPVFLGALSDYLPYRNRRGQDRAFSSLSRPPPPTQWSAAGREKRAALFEVDNGAPVFSYASAITQLYLAAYLPAEARFSDARANPLRNRRRCGLSAAERECATEREN